LEDKARQYALKLLSYRGRSVRELEERLEKKGFSQPVIRVAVQRLSDVGLIDDRALADSLIRQAVSTKLLGKKGVLRFMRVRGVPDEIISSLTLPGEEDELENARKLVRKKLPSLKGYPEEKIRRRLYNFLIRKGYSFDIINAAFKNRGFLSDDTEE
jgi:regulatory protein